MEIRGFEWDDFNESHIVRHSVTPDEAEEVLLAGCFIRRSHSGRYGAFGRSLAGRYLFIVVEKVKGGIIRVVTARDMSAREQRFFRRLKG